MKTLFLTCIGCLFFVSAKAQETKPADSLYIVTYTTGPAWDASKAPHEQPYFKEHSANLD